MKYRYLGMGMLCAALFLNADFLRAQDVEVNLDKVVITGSKTGVNKDKSAGLVQVADRDLISSNSAMSLSENINLQCGLRVEDNCQNCGHKTVRINGLDGAYTQLMIDSRPVNSALASMYLLEEMPINIVRQVEVIKGGGSALYGGSAVAGSLNIITERPYYSSIELSHKMIGVGFGDSFDNLTSLKGSLVKTDKSGGLDFFAQNRQRQAYCYYGDGYSTLPKIDLQDFGVKCFRQTTDNQRFDMLYMYVDDFRRGGNKLDEAPELANVDEQTQNHVHLLNLDYCFDYHKVVAKLYTSASYVNRKSYIGGYGSDDEPDELASLYHTLTNDLYLTDGVELRYSFAHCFSATAGYENTYNTLEDKSLGFDLQQSQTTLTNSLFVQGEWQKDMFSMLLGGRLEKNSNIGHPIFSPRLNIRLQPFRKLNVRLSYSEGYRAPQIYSDDLHITLANGERHKTVNADGLDFEKSRSLSLSAEYNRSFGTFRIDGTTDIFCTNLDNVFVESELDERDADGCLLFLRTNGNGANVYGISNELNFKLFDKFKIDCGVTLQRSRYTEPEEWSDEAEPTDRMMKTPGCYGFVSSEYALCKYFDIDLTGTYTGSMTVPHFAGSGTDHDVAVVTPDFWDLSISVCYNVKIGTKCAADFSVGVINILNQYQDDLDKGYDRDTEYFFGPLLPRSLMLEARFKFF